MTLTSALEQEPTLEIGMPTVLAVSRATPRQLDYWVRTHMIPMSTPMPGSGVPRRWTVVAAYQAAALAQLSSLGVQPGQVANALSPWPMLGAYLVLKGDRTAQVVDSVEELVAALKPGADGVALRVVLDLGAIRSDVDDRLAERAAS